MVHSPRLLEFELYIIEHSLRLLTNIGQVDFMSRSSLEEDEAELNDRIDPGQDWNLFTIVKLNAVTKRIYNEHKKTVLVL